jgi:hypothetical protein
MKAYWGVDKLEVSVSFIPGGRAASTHCIEGWVDPRTGFDALGRRIIVFVLTHTATPELT